MADLLSSHLNRARAPVAALATASLLALAGCGADGADQAQAAQQQQQMAAQVDVVTLQPQAVESTRILPARATAFAEAEIRPQVSGLIKERLFTEGQQVAAGDALYQIEPSEYRSAFESARAGLARAEATAETARQTTPGRPVRRPNAPGVIQFRPEESQVG